MGPPSEEVIVWNRQVRVNSPVRVANAPMMYSGSHVYVTLPWTSTSFAERDASDTSGGTMQLRGENTEKTSQDFPLRISHQWTV